MGGGGGGGEGDRLQSNENKNVNELYCSFVYTLQLSEIRSTDLLIKKQTNVQFF